MKNGKKYAPSEEEIVYVNQILIRCVVQIDRLNRMTAEEYSRVILKQLKSEKKSATSLLRLTLTKMDSGSLYSPRLINKSLANMKPVDELVKEALQVKYLSDSQLSKVLSDFVNKGLLIKIKNKEQLKSFLAKEKKYGRKRSVYNTGGRISLYHTSSSVDRLRNALSDQKIKEIIYHSLNKSGLLQKYVEIQLKGYARAITNKKVYDFVRTVNKDLGLNDTEWNEFMNFFQSLNDKQIEKIAAKMVENMPVLENQTGLSSYLFGAFDA